MLSMTKAERLSFVGGLVSLAVYVVVAWLSARLFDVTLWRALAVLLIARTFFGIVEWSAGVLNWRLFGKRAVVKEFLEVLRANEFPQRYWQHESFWSYLARIEEDAKLSRKTRRAATEFERLLGAGGFAALRAESAAEAALEEYSPRALAPTEL